ncbi:hypothetical protein Ocin01_04249 [Orchesella cincta]|uniref:Uncharacterized protein n=1 Tax=Orchesella cincta TaxID=48709 RepID=A0A1D2NB12_ORCCI|nr:hypothetical protein Ocin01_04249 [Orchesella cincta]
MADASSVMITDASTNNEALLSGPANNIDSSNNDTKVTVVNNTENSGRTCCGCVWTTKMKILVVLGISLTVISIAGACLFRNPTLFMYPLHASCNVTWTFQQDCTQVRDKLVLQMELWKDDTNCGTGQKCLYTMGETKENELHATHTTPKAKYIDDMYYKFYTNSATGGCNVIGYSTSRIFFAVLDFGTNYCNIHNLVEGAGLPDDPHYSELTRDEICTQYTSANCEKY